MARVRKSKSKKQTPPKKRPRAARAPRRGSSTKKKPAPPAKKKRAPSRKPTPAPKKKPARKAQPKKPAKKPARRAQPKKKRKAPSPARSRRSREAAARRRESQEASEQAYRAKRTRGHAALADDLEDALQTMLDHANSVLPTMLNVELAPENQRTLWLVLGEFQFPEGVSYLDMAEIFARWSGDDLLAARIHPERLAQIRVEYGRNQWAAMSAIGPWEVVISEAEAQVDPDDESSWANKYTEETERALYVYFSTELAGRREIAL
jgi:hypothetical protein